MRTAVVTNPQCQLPVLAPLSRLQYAARRKHWPALSDHNICGLTMEARNQPLKKSEAPVYSAYLPLAITPLQSNLKPSIYTLFCGKTLYLSIDPSRRLEVRRKWADVMRDYYSRVKSGDPLLAARTPDDQIRLVSYLFASTKQLDKVRAGRRHRQQSTSSRNRPSAHSKARTACCWS